MLDPRISKLAKLLSDYSVSVKPGDRVMIATYDVPTEMTNELIKYISSLGAHTFVETVDTKVMRSEYLYASKESMEIKAASDLEMIKQMDCYISIRGSNNAFELCDVPAERMKLIRDIRRPVVNHRVNNTAWCVLRWPTVSMAQSANMSTEEFEDFYFNVCTLDYSKMKLAASKLVDLMNRTDSVRLIGAGTDISFSIKDIPAIACSGEMNIPDGEVFTAPIKNSVNGIIQYNTPTVYEGKRFENIKLEFKDGKIISATASDTDALNQILDTDDGARYIGEFAIGFNPYITKAMCDILFDEKIAGSIHFTPGKCYEDASNGNNSAIHWDMVMIQTLEYGGGSILFDGVTIRENGVFTHPELLGLNPDQLK